MNRLLTLAVLLLVAIPGALFFLRRANATHALKMGASKVGSDSYLVAQAIAETTRERFPEIQIELVPTGGSTDSVGRLAAKEIQLAAIQADIPIAPEARLVAQLYPDVFQLVAHADSGIETVADLRGKRVALPKSTSGQYTSFWFVANHYGLTRGDLIEVTASSVEEANQKLAQHEVDALFRVRPPGNASIRELVETAPVRLVPIDQAEAVRLREPAAEQGVIAKGSYRGHSPVPSEDLPTIAVQRLLVAHHEVPDYVVARITEVLFEFRKDLVAASTLAGFITQPNRLSGTFIPIHSGADNYYNREEPSFLQEQAEPLALLITLLAILLSAVVKLQRQRQKARVQVYNDELLELLHEAEHLTDRRRLEEITDRLNAILREAVTKRNRDQITPEDFEFFSFVWEMARDEANEESVVGAASSGN